MQQNRIYAQILERQGFFKEAFVIYQKLLEYNPDDKELKVALKRLKKIRSRFSGVDEEKKEFFIKMKKDDEFREFEKWLLEGF